MLATIEHRALLAVMQAIFARPSFLLMQFESNYSTLPVASKLLA